MTETPTPPTGSRETAKQALCARGLKQLRLCDVPAYQEAAALLALARESDPDSVAVHAGLAEANLRWGWRREIVGLPCRTQYEDGYADACRALELDPGSGDAHRAMSAALRHGRWRDPVLGLGQAERAWDIDSRSGENGLEFWRARGRTADDPLIERVFALDPDLCAAHIDVGVALTEAGNHAEAAYHLERALELSPGNTLARYDLAMVLFREDRAEEASRMLTAALEESPGEPLFLRGLEYIRRERADAAA